MIKRRWSLEAEGLQTLGVVVGLPGFVFGGGF